MSMTPNRSLALLSLFSALAAGTTAPAAEPFRFPEAKHKGGELKYINDLPVLTLQGTPEELGEQAAVLTAASVKPLLELPKEIVRRHRLELAWPLFAAAADELMKNVPAEYRTELETAVKVGKVDRETVVVGNCLLELRRLGGCATLYVDPKQSETKAPLLGRNFDLDPLGLLDKYSLVTVAQPKGKRAFCSIGYPGLVGVVSGINDAGLTVATLDVYLTKDGATLFDPRGTPLTFCYRRILEECATVDEAAKLMRSLKATTCMNLAVCDKTEGAIFEITPKQVVVRRPDKGVLPCTNHFNTPDLYLPIPCWRYEILRKLEKRKESFSVKDVAAAMHSVNQRTWTLQTMVFEPATLKLHLSIGQPPVSARPLKTLELAKLLEPRL
jgi:hypothetical protein